MNLEILPARPEDIPSLHTIAFAAKSHWGYPEHLMADFAADELVTVSSLQIDTVYVAWVEHEPVGWVCLLGKPIREGVRQLEDLWVMPTMMGRGIGRALFEHALEVAQRDGMQAIELDADPNAVSFYEKMGCQIIGETKSSWDRMIPRMRFEFSPKSH